MSRLWILPAAVCLAALTYSAAQRADRLTSAAAGLLIVANKGDHSLGIVDPATGRQVATVPEGGVTGHELIASPDGKTAYVPIYGDSGVGHPGSDGRRLAVIDLARAKSWATWISATACGRIALCRPRWPALCHDRNR